MCPSLFPTPSLAIYHVHVYTWPSCLHICATVESVFVFRFALWADERCVRGRARHQRMLLIPGFFGSQLESQLSPHPALTHTHQGVASTSLDMPPDSLRPGAADIVSGWVSLTYTLWCFGALRGSKPVSADGHSSAGLVSLADSGHVCVSLCTHVGENPAPKS